MAVSNATGAGAALSNGCAINERLRRVALSANVAARCMKVVFRMGYYPAVLGGTATDFLPASHGATILRADHGGCKRRTIQVSVG